MTGYGPPKEVCYCRVSPAAPLYLRVKAGRCPKHPRLRPGEALYMVKGEAARFGPPWELASAVAVALGLLLASCAPPPKPCHPGVRYLRRVPHMAPRQEPVKWANGSAEGALSGFVAGSFLNPTMPRKPGGTRTRERQGRRLASPAPARPVARAWTSCGQGTVGRRTPDPLTIPRDGPAGTTPKQEPTPNGNHYITGAPLHA